MQRAYTGGAWDLCNGTLFCQEKMWRLWTWRVGKPPLRCSRAFLSTKSRTLHILLSINGKEVATISGKGVVLSRWRVSSGSIEQNDQQPNNSGDNEAGRIMDVLAILENNGTLPLLSLWHTMLRANSWPLGERSCMQSLGRSSWILHAQLSWIRWARSWREISPRPFGRTARCLL